MARRSRQDEEKISLFPFMSILTCLIGILTLLISAALVSKEEAEEGMTEEEMERAEENVVAKAAILKNEAELAKLKAEVAAKNKTVQQRQNLLTEKKKLEDQINKLPDSKTDTNKLKQKIAQLNKRVAQLKEQKEKIQADTQKVKKEVTRRENLPEPKEVVQLTKGTGSAGKAGNLFFVECNGKQIQLYKNGKKADVIKQDDIDVSPVYKSFLIRIKDTKRTSTVIFLLRKSSWDAYLWAVHVAENEFQLQTGKLAVPGDGEIDLSKLYPETTKLLPPIPLT